MKKTTVQKILPYLLIFPSIMIMVTVIFYPIAVSLLRSFQLEEGGWGPDNYIFFFTDRIQRGNKGTNGAGDYHFFKPVVLYAANPRNRARHSEKRQPTRH